MVIILVPGSLTMAFTLILTISKMITLIMIMLKVISDHIDNDYLEGDHIDNDYLEGDQLLCHGGSKRRKEGQCKGERSTTFLSVNFEEVSLCTGRILWCELCQKYTGAL